jgi:hypothetical protein
VTRKDIKGKFILYSRRGERINYPKKEYKKRRIFSLQASNYKQKEKRGNYQFSYQKSWRNKENTKGFMEELRETHTHTSK